jgi:pyruvate dehydrogenase E1 component alpha subunit
VAAVYAATKDAADWARAGNGPSMIEGLTYRWYDHAGFAGARPTVDGAWGLPYRSDEEVRQWMTRDPIVRFKTWLLSKKLATAAELANVEADTQSAVEAALSFARSGRNPDPAAGVLNTDARGPMPATQFFNRSGLATPPRTT